MRKSEHNTAIPGWDSCIQTCGLEPFMVKFKQQSQTHLMLMQLQLYIQVLIVQTSSLSVNGTSSSVVSTSNNTITSNGHGFVDDEIVYYSSGLDGSGNAYGAIGGLEDGKMYYVYGKTTNTFKLSHTNSFMGDAGLQFH